MKSQTLSKRLPRFLLIFLIICIVADLLVLALESVFYDLSKAFNNNIIQSLGCFSNALFLILVIASIIYFVIRVKKDGWNALFPVASHGITIILIALLFFQRYGYSISPFEDFRTKLELSINKSYYEKTIKMVENGALQIPCTDGECFGRQTLSQSSGDFILFEKRNGVISVFFSLKGLHFGSVSGLMYRSNDTSPSSSLMDGFWVACNREAPNWYYCVNSD